MSAVDFPIYFPFDSGLGANVLESQWGRKARRWAATGVLWGDSTEALNKLEVYSNVDGVQIHVKSGKCYIRGHYAELTSDTILTLTAPNASNPRIDYIVAMADFTANKIQLVSIDGTPAASPVAPTIGAYQTTTQWAIPLATVRVNVGDPSIPSTGRIVDKRQFSLEPGKHYDAMVIVSGVGSTSGLTTIPSGAPSNFLFSTSGGTRDPLGMFTAATDRLIMPMDGIAQPWAYLEWAANATGFRELQLEYNGSVIERDTRQANGANVVGAHLAAVPRQVVRGDYFRLLGLQTSLGALGWTPTPLFGCTWQGYTA
jgi:hypothetical protein